MTRWSWSFSLVSLALLSSSASVAATEQVNPPIEWVQRNLIVDLQNMPTRYSCADLWYRFRDILLAVGAKPTMEIVPNRCEARLGPGARSPHVHLRFEIPRQPNLEQGRLRDEEKTVQFLAGQPRSLDDDDCELLRQVKSTLFESLNVRVMDFKLDCGVPTAARPPWHLTVKILAPDLHRSLHAGLPAAKE